MKDDTPQRVQALQSSMEKSAAVFFLETQLEDLRVLIRLTLEFHDYLHGFGSRPELEPRHTCEAVFGGVESFTMVMRGYKGSFGPKSSSLERTVSLPLLKAQFLPLFDGFIAEQSFERRCGLLLDLFRLQIVFAGMMYE